jgi:hypothetical protein
MTRRCLGLGWSIKIFYKTAVRRYNGFMLEQPGALRERDDYLTRQLITYIGNKRPLLHFIGLGIEEIQRRLNKNVTGLYHHVY